MNQPCNFIKTIFFILLLIPAFSYGQDSLKTEKALSIVPLITSSPLMGVGLGAAASFLYTTGEGTSSKSQLQIGGQYSNTKSFTTFIKNNAWFKINKIFSATAITYSGINNEFNSDGEDVAYNVNTFLMSELLMFKISKNIYLGGPLKYKNLKYTANNEAGEDFLYDNGFQDENSLGLGISSSYDTRKNKYFPVKATFITLNFNTNPTWLGAVDSYYSFVVDARYYVKGFSTNDAWAWQLYGQYSSEKTPDSGLPTLSGKTLLRGFPAGQFKAKHITGAQTEYRYTLGESRFRITGFYGVANLSGGSYGIDDRSRHDDGWYSAGGIGARYKIQQVTGVDLRLDFVRTNIGENSIYLMLNQAF